MVRWSRVAEAGALMYLAARNPPAVLPADLSGEPVMRLSVWAVAVLLALAGCAPQNTNTTYSAEDIGRTANVSFGTIISMRPVTVQSQSSGIGALGGAAAGGAAGSFIGGSDVKGNILGAIGGAIIGGVVGNAVENQSGTGQAVEFIIHEDFAPAPISVVQTNELNFQPGERVVITRGARTRLARGAPPPPPES
jgi:outer membrane lipoprotein SlyB